MKNRRYNYMVEGIHTLLQLFIIVRDENLDDKSAYEEAIRLAKKKWTGRKINVFEN